MAEFKKRRTKVLLLLLVVALIPASSPSAYPLNEMSSRIVFTKQGPVQGYLGPPPLYPSVPWQHLGGRPIVEIFRGIPYASSNRYESPAPVPQRSRTEVFLANTTRPSCPRTSEEVLNRTNVKSPFKALRRLVESGVEDCLYLDIWVPFTSLYHQQSVDKGKPGSAGFAVLVYMNSHPDDPDNPFDGSSMAAIGSIVVVSVRYRTGVLGFLQPSYSEDVRSNFGLWDQLAALQWIKENIGEFGGDMNNISLMGFDIDATVAGLLALSPVSQAYNGLFHRLILLNGSPLAPNAINPEPIRTTYQLARALPCPLDERTGDLGKCLRSMPVTRIVSAAEKQVGAPLLVRPFSPVADGIIVPHEVNSPHPAESPAVQEMLKRYDILCGIKEGPVLPRVGRAALTNLDLDRFITAVVKLTMKMESGAEPTEEVKRAIRSAIINDQGYGSAPPMRELLSDFLMVQPIIDLLNAHSKTGRRTWFYVFKDFDPLNLMKFDEISYIFSTKVYNWKYLGAMSHTKKLHSFVILINLLSNFVRNGDPNISDPTDRFQPTIKGWPQYSESYGRYLEVADDTRFPSDYRKVSTDFWGKTVPAIIKSFANKSSFLSDTQFPPPFYPKQSHYYPLPGEEAGYDINEEEEGVILGAQSTVVIVGCVLLLLNFLCFMGLFYQKERLKKAEIQLRKRYLQAQAAVSEREAEEAAPSPPPPRSNQGTLTRSQPPPQQKPRDNMSETETENGFGPDFLGPNYDPRTKVNRWMLMQSRMDGYPGRPPPPPLPYNPYHPHHHPPPYENPYELEANEGEPQRIYHPLHIQISSRQKEEEELKKPPKAQPEPPVQFLPQLPYQTPFKPVQGSDIPYADSRATSPSIISAPARYPYPSYPPPIKEIETLEVVPVDAEPTPPAPASSDTTTTNSTGRKGILVTNTNPGNKRSSTLIVRDLDPPDPGEESEPKYVPVKVGTLKRSVAVDTDHDNGEETFVLPGQSQVRVTFKENL